MASKVSFIIQLKDQFGATAAKVDRQFKKIKRSADKAKTSVVSFAKKTKQSFIGMRKQMAATGAGMTAALTVPIALLGKSMIDTASDAEETANKFKEVFKGIGPTANKAVSEISTGFKLATSTTQELLSDTGDLLVGLGLTREQALKMSSDVVRLSADVASFKNVQGGTERASTALTKALLGEREMLKETFKTAVLEEEVKKRAAIIRLKDRKLTLQQAKAFATLAIVTDRNRDAIGDLARTQDAYANVARESAEAGKQLSESFGRLLLPVAVKVQKFLTRVANAIDSLSPGMKKIVLILAAVVAIGGPLLLILAGIAVAFTVISLPVLLVTAAILALGAVIALVALNWDSIVQTMREAWNGFSDVVGGTIDQIGTNFVNMWEGVKASFVGFINLAIQGLNDLLVPLNFVAEKLGFGGVQISQIGAPSAPTGGGSASVNGEIVVSAESGARVNSTRFATKGSGLNMGLNMVGAN